MRVGSPMNEPVSLQRASAASLYYYYYYCRGSRGATPLLFH